MNEMPGSEKLSEVANSINKRGVFKTLLLITLVNIPSILLAITLNWKQTQTINSLRLQIRNSNNLNIENNFPKSTNDEEQVSGKQEVSGASTDFISEKWITEKFQKDKEGYYCNEVNGFDYWSLWSKESLTPTTSLRVRFQIKTRKDNNQAALMISYGEYKTGFSSTTYYRLIILENGNSIRLYNDKNESVQQVFLIDKPDLSKEMVLSLDPRSIGENLNKLSLNPTLSYIPEQNSVPVELKPQKEFVTELPLVNIEDTTLKKQLGIGTNRGSCFKINSIEF